MANKRFLVVEDHRSTSVVVVDSLRSFFPGWKISQAASEKEALQKILDERPDVVILDIALPDGNGLNIVRKLAKNPWEIKPGLVVVTAFSDKATEGPRLGRPWLDQLEADERRLVTAFFEKPFRWRGFLTALAQAGRVPDPEAVATFQDY